jgi:hypothetical protein
MKKVSRLLSVFVFLFMQIVSYQLVFEAPSFVSAQGECTAGYYPKTVPAVTNGNFAIAPATVYPSGAPGNSYITPGHNYSDASFISQVANAGTDIYPVLLGDTINAFSVQTGDFDGSPSIPVLNQLHFPGDPTYSVPSTNTWFYSNGNMHNGTEYLVWQQDVTGLTNGNDYVFVAYISNVIDSFDAAADPIITLKTGGAAGMPDGTTILGPLTLTEAATSNSSALNGWQRVAFRFTASGTTESLKIVDSAISMAGDDFAMTAIGLQECTPVPDYTITLDHTGAPAAGGSYMQNVTVANIGTGNAEAATSVSISLPTGFTVNAGAAGSLSLTTNTASYSCTSNALAPQTITCSSSTVVPFGGSQNFSFPVAIAGTASNSSTVSATVSVPLEDNTSNNSDTDPVSIAPDVATTLTLSNQTSSAVTVQTTVENVGTAYTSGSTTVTHTLPDGVVANNGAAGSVAITGDDASNWTCTSDAATPQVITCVTSTVLQNNDASDQVFQFTLGITKTVTNINIVATATAAGDSNSSNNSDTEVLSSSTSAPAAATPTLAKTGIRVVMSTLLATSIIGGVIFSYRTARNYAKRYRLYS